MTISQIDNSRKGRFQIKDGGLVLGELTYTWTDADIMRIDHTNVDPEFEGRGIGKALVMATVKFARQKDIKIVLRCPFAKNVFARTEDIRDVLL